MIQQPKIYELSQGDGSVVFTVQHKEPNPLIRQNPRGDPRVLNFHVRSTGLDADDLTISVSKSNTGKGADAIPIDDSTQVIDIIPNDNGNLILRDIEANSSNYWIVITVNSVRKGKLEFFLNILT